MQRLFVILDGLCLTYTVRGLTAVHPDAVLGPGGQGVCGLVEEEGQMDPQRDSYKMV